MTTAGEKPFDGEAISRADRKFLRSLGDHPVAHNPLYGAPPPPIPSANTDETCEACFVKALEWMLVNYAYYVDAFIGKGGVISLVDGKITTVSAMRGYLQPYAKIEHGPRGGRKTISVVDVWMSHRQRARIDAVQARPDRLRPTYEEEGLTIYNRYWPPALPQSGGTIEPFVEFFARLVPDEAERTWLWNYLSHKARRPWIPMIAVIMVAEEFGTGRGTLFDILKLMFGKDYVVPCHFNELTGQAAGSRFNARLADALFVTVNEADGENGEQQSQRRLHYDALKNLVEPSPTALRRFEAKGQNAYTQRSAATFMFATNHRDMVKLPQGDRRFGVVTCGAKMTPAEREQIQAWMAVPENIGALHRALLAAPAVPVDVFDPFGEPPAFRARIEMIDMGKSQLEDAYEEAMIALNGCPLFTMTQAQRLVSYFSDAHAGDGSAKIKFAIAKNAYRLRRRGEAGNRVKYRKRQEIIYAATRHGRQQWRKADAKMVMAALDRAEARVTEVIHAERDVLADLTRVL